MKKSLLETIGIDATHITSEAQNVAVAKALQIVTQREEKVLRFYFGIGEEKKTLDEIGQHFAVTKKRVVQIRNKAMRKLKSPPKLVQLKRELGLSSNDVASGLKFQEKAALLLRLSASVSRMSEEIQAMQRDIALLRSELSYPNSDLNIDNLEISVRTYSGLKSLGVKSLIELTTMSEGELLKVKNFGRKSLNEVKDLMSVFGLQFHSNLSYLESMANLKKEEQP